MCFRVENLLSFNSGCDLGTQFTCFSWYVWDFLLKEKKKKEKKERRQKKQQQLYLSFLAKVHL